MKEHDSISGGLPVLLTVAEVALVLKVTRWTVKNWIRAGKLSAVQLGGPRTIRISDVDLTAFVKGNRDGSRISRKR